MRRLGLGALAMLGCAEPAAPTASPPRAPSVAVQAAPASAASPPTMDWSALRASEAGCADCHPDEVAAWRASPMGRSLGRLPDAAVEVSRAATVVHPVTGLSYSVEWAADRAVFTESGSGVRDERTASWFVGSGAHTRSFFFQAGDGFFQMPLTWYARSRAWDLSPGYAVAEHPGFHREVRADCIACHGEPLRPIAGTRARFAAHALHPIGCGRCHGDARAHAADPTEVKPVVLSKLAPERAQDVCDQCHFSGAVRVLREGRQPADFVPGMRLDEVFAVFVAAEPGDALGIASHGERLRRSACARSAPLGCTTCHAPHRGGAKRDRSAPCRDCHDPAGATHCAAPGGPDCVSCHMARAATTDIPHTQITDHHIRVAPGPRSLGANDAHAPPSPRLASAPSGRSPAFGSSDARVSPRPPGPLTPAGPPLSDDTLVRAGGPDAPPADDESRRLLGRAYADRARQGLSAARAEAARQRALALLVPGLTGASASPSSLASAWLDLAAMRHLGGDAAGARDAAERAWTLAPGEAQVAATTATTRLGTNDPEGALAAADRGLRAEPGAVDLLVFRANALTSLGRFEEALAPIEAALRARPTDGGAWMAAGTRALFADGAAAAQPAFARASMLTPGRSGPWIARIRAELILEEPGVAATAAEARRRLSRATSGPLPVAVAAFLDGASALVAWRDGRRAEAAAAAARVLAAWPGSAEAAVVLSEQALVAGRPLDAVKRLEPVLRLTPDSALAWDALARARRAAALAGAEEAARRAHLFGRPPSRSSPP